jgi:hypothetical protein
MQFLPKNEVKMCGESEFDIDKIPRIQEKLYIDAKITYFGLKTTLFLIFICNNNNIYSDFDIQNLMNPNLKFSKRKRFPDSGNAYVY